MGLDLKLKGIIVLLMISGFIAGLGAGNPIVPANTDAKKDTLIFRITWKAYSGRGEAIQKLVNSYNSTSKDDYEIKMSGGDEDIDLLKDILDKDSSKDINININININIDILVLPYRFVQYFGYGNKLMDLTKDFEEERDLF